MENNQEILKNLDIEISKTIGGKEQVILDRKYKFNFSSKKGDLKKYKCTEYKNYLVLHVLYYYIVTQYNYLFISLH